MARRDKGDDNLPENDQSDRPPIALILSAILAVLAVVFVVQNTGDANVSFLWIDFTSSLWFVIIVSIVLGILIDRLFGMWWRRRGRSTDD